MVKILSSGTILISNGFSRILAIFNGFKASCYLSKASQLPFMVNDLYWKQIFAILNGFCAILAEFKRFLCKFSNI